MKDKMENQLADVLQALANAFQNESDKEHLSAVKKLIADNEHLDITKPEMFGLLTTLTLDEQRDLLARIALANHHVTTENFDALSFVYTHYDFMERHLDNVIVRYEGMACSADKTRWLLDSYAAFIISGELPVIKERRYWHPQLMDVELWMNWMRSFAPLYYGNETDYVQYKQQIKERYQADIDKTLRSIHKTMTENAYYADVSEEESYGKTKTVYHFVNPETTDKGTILVDSIADISYRFFFEGEQRHAKHKDTLPAWFQTLITSK